MPTIKFGGLASGLDTNGIIQGLLQVEQIPLNRLEGRRATAESAQRLFNDLASKARELESLAERLQDPTELSVRSATTSDEAALSATASSTASVGSHTLTVHARARASRLAAQGYADASATGQIGSGTLAITVGATTTNVTIDPGADSLEAVRDAINDADAGVTASVVNDGTGTPYRLVISGDDTGLANAVSLDASGLTGGSDPLTFSTLTTAQDAQFELDGLTMYRSSNLVSDAIDGVTFELHQEDPARELTLDVGVDADASAAQVQELVDSVNSLLETIRDESQPGIEGAAGGILLGDFVANTAKQRLASAIRSATGPASAINLSSIGVTTNRDGTLEVDAAKVAEAFTTNPEGVTALLTDAATHLEATAGELGLSNDGIFANRAKALDQQIRRIDDQIDRKELSLEKMEEALTLRFAALETLSSRLQSQAGFLAQIGSNSSS